VSAKRDGSTCDCVVIGGGPAGATAATLLADHGHHVIVLEQSPFPRHHVGESLMPQTYWTFKRLGMLDKMKASSFPRKESVQFISASAKESLPYFFTDRDPHECSVTWQVKRDLFDKMMLDNAAEHGAEVRYGLRVRRVLFEGTRATGIVYADEEQPRHLHAGVVVDASGQSSLIARQLELRNPDPDLKKASIYAYFKGAARDEGRNAGATIVIHTPGHNGWFWQIPLPDDVASVGVVSDPGVLFTGRGSDPLATLEEEIARCPAMAKRLANAERISGAYVTSDFSYHARRMAGDGWVLVGDAFGFVDPIYSSGVMLAMKSAEFAADAVHEGLQAEDVSAERLGAFAPKLLGGMHLIRRLVHAFYDRDFSFARFHREHPEYHDHLVRILIGDVFDISVGKMFDAVRERIHLPEPIQLENGAGRLCGE